MKGHIAAAELQVNDLVWTRNGDRFRIEAITVADDRVVVEGFGGTRVNWLADAKVAVSREV